MPSLHRIAFVAALVCAVPAAASQDPELGVRRRMTPPSVLALHQELLELTGDGLLDLFLRGPSGLQIWRGEPDGSFREVAWSLGLVPGAQDYEFLDADGDGDQDLVIARSGTCVKWTCTGTQDYLFVNDGAGHLTQVLGVLPPNDLNANDLVEAGDVDGDGDLDLVLGGHLACGEDLWGFTTCSSSASRVWKSDGAGTFNSAAGAPVADGRLVRMLLADFSGDGAVELFGSASDLEQVTFGPDQKVYYANDGTGVFTPAHALAGQHASQWLAEASAGDVDLDGDLDLVATYWDWLASPDARLFRNDGTGALHWDAGELAGATYGVHALADLDQDLDLDLVLGSESGARLFANDGTGHFADAGPFGSAVGQRALVGDVDLDLDLDVLLDQRLHLQDGLGAFADATEPLPPPAGSEGTSDHREVALLDVELDGDLDAALVDAFAPSALFANDGAAHFAAVDAGAWSASAEKHVVLAADLDGDGDDDLAAGGGFAGANVALFENQLGTFPAALALPGTARARAAVAADVDLDGDLDLVIGRDESFVPLPHVLFANHLGTFTEVPGAMPPAAAVTHALAVVDYDGDGDPDLVEAADGGDRFYRNDGGIFAEIASVLPPPGPGLTRDWSVADVDLDGLPDLMGVAIGPPASGRLYLGTGAGFADASASLPPGVSAQALDLFDADLDGDPDALWLGPADRMLLANDGAGHFTGKPTSAPAPGSELSLAAGDLDGDLDGDAFVVGGRHHAVLLSLHRQLAWRAIPRAGKPLAFDVDGSPGAPFVQAWSPGAAAIPLAPFGVLRLDPAHLHVLASGTLDGQGTAVVATALPATPSLIGATVATQALIGSPLRFSNLERVTVTGL